MRAVAAVPVLLVLLAAACAGAEEVSSPSRQLLTTNGVFDKIGDMLVEGADVTKKFAATLERGAGGMGSAGNRVSEAVTSFTGRAKDVGQKVFTSMGDAADKVADWVKTPFTRQRSGAQEGGRIRQESGRVAESEDGSFEADDGAEGQSSRPSPEERQALQRAQAEKRAEQRQAQQAARAAVRQARQMARHAPGMRMEAFYTPQQHAL